MGGSRRWEEGTKVSDLERLFDGIQQDIQKLNHQIERYHDGQIDADGTLCFIEIFVEGMFANVMYLKMRDQYQKRRNLIKSDMTDAAWQDVYGEE
jgi:Rod binding domain-containing protein